MTKEDFENRFKDFNNSHYRITFQENKVFFESTDNSKTEKGAILVDAIRYIVETDFGYFIILQNGIVKLIHKSANFCGVYIPPVDFEGQEEIDNPEFCYYLFIYRDIFGGSELAYKQNSIVIKSKLHIPFDQILEIEFTSKELILSVKTNHIYRFAYDENYLKNLLPRYLSCLN